ncbi:MAG TPA: hypothetical protein VK988_22390 [Acidimicrobiales bacterium]|nr:hypothetical protein [Acidimicrobiales bacterium]
MAVHERAGRRRLPDLAGLVVDGVGAAPATQQHGPPVRLRRPVGALKTTNPIKFTFATVRLPHRGAKGPGLAGSGTSDGIKLIEVARDRWRTVNGPSAATAAGMGWTRRATSAGPSPHPRSHH